MSSTLIIIISIVCTSAVIILAFCARSIRKELINEDIRLDFKNNHKKSLKGNFIRRYTTPIEADYYIDHFNAALGKGSFGVVVVGINKQNGNSYAIKMVNKATGKASRIERELKLCKDVDHSNIIRLYAAYDTVDRLGFVMELCSGGHLGQIAEDGIGLSTQKAKSYMRQLLSAVSHMHNRGICHRDIKLQNILVESIQHTAQIKLIDFGFGTRFVGALPLTTRCGTLYTTAPEVFKQCYDQRCDVWSCGVICYILLCGVRPFKANNKKSKIPARDVVISKILEYKLFFHAKMKQDDRSFIKKLLHYDYKHRCEASEALEEIWLQPEQVLKLSVRLDRPSLENDLAKAIHDAQRQSYGYSTALKEHITKQTVMPIYDNTPDLKENQQILLDNFELSVIIGTVANMKRNSLLSTLHRTSMVAIAYLLPQSKIDKSRKIFQVFDSDCDGALSRSEFHSAMQACISLQDTSSKTMLVSNDIGKLFDIIDINSDGQISLTEFVAITMNPSDVSMESLKAVFDIMDRNQKGYITVNDMVRVLCVSRVVTKQKDELKRRKSTSNFMPTALHLEEKNEDDSVEKRRRGSWSNIFQNRPTSRPCDNKIIIISDEKSEFDNSLLNSDEIKQTQKHKENIAKKYLQKQFNLSPSRRVELESVGETAYNKQSRYIPESDFDPALLQQVYVMMKRCNIERNGYLTFDKFVSVMTSVDDNTCEGMVEAEEKQNQRPKDRGKSEEDGENGKPNKVVEKVLDLGKEVAGGSEADSFVTCAEYKEMSTGKIVVKKENRAYYVNVENADDDDGSKDDSGYHFDTSRYVTSFIHGSIKSAIQLSSRSLTMTDAVSDNDNGSVKSFDDEKVESLNGNYGKRGDGVSDAPSDNMSVKINVSPSHDNEDNALSMKKLLQSDSLVSNQSKIHHDVSDVSLSEIYNEPLEDEDGNSSLVATGVARVNNTTGRLKSRGAFTPATTSALRKHKLSLVGDDKKVSQSHGSGSYSFDDSNDNSNYDKSSLTRWVLYDNSISKMMKKGKPKAEEKPNLSNLNSQRVHPMEKINDYKV